MQFLCLAYGAENSTDAYANGPAPLVGFALVEAADLDEVIGLAASTPCAVARGANPYCLLHDHFGASV